jgi:hypothetical protein
VPLTGWVLSKPKEKETLGITATWHFGESARDLRVEGKRTEGSAVGASGDVSQHTNSQIWPSSIDVPTLL